ncbi:butyrophilin-like protein 2 isoform X2 [Melanotaenia boesemani]|uniref:butyrophilin-like protein 2 isoform X2 n=1 Tax=Melanotaenia boesemani TaxID=1250792 RepID=UPI001C0562A2|nr:butyrophilin-like protein 2 isoform X2 [Melanotaenia boesemani]
MMMFKLLFWTGCYSLLSVTEQVTAETEIFCSSEPVVSFCGSSIVLQCHLEPQQDATDNTVKWTQQSDVVHIRKGGKDDPGEQMERFEGRTSLFSEGLHKGNLSLQLSSLKLSDSGRYKCSFQVGSVEKSCYVNLSVGESEVIGSPEPVTAESGQDVVLPCHLKPRFDATTLTVEWRWNKATVHVYRNLGDYEDPQDQRFKGRTSLFHDEMIHGNISLKLSKVTEEDAGIYTCFVPNLNCRVKKGNIALKVAETEIFCSSEPVVSFCGSSIVLQCHLEPQQDATDNTVKWTQQSDVVHIRKGGKDIPGEQMERFEERTSLISEGLHKGNLSLQLSSLKLSDSGRYKCSFQVGSVEKSCYVNLSVRKSKVIGSPEPVTAESGQDVVLPCHLKPRFDVTTLTVEWRWNKATVHVYRNLGDYKDPQDQRFKGRTSLFHNEMTHGNISLKLSKVTEEDAGIYTCFVPNLNCRVKKGIIVLKVEESKVIGSPDPVTAESGQDVVLPCRLEPPFDVTTLTVEWRWNKATVHVYRNLRDYKDPQDQRFKGRTSLFHNEMIHGNISLKLSKVTEEDAGIYTCFVPKLNSQVKKGIIVLKVGRRLGRWWHEAVLQRSPGKRQAHDAEAGQDGQDNNVNQDNIE